MYNQTGAKLFYKTFYVILAIFELFKSEID